MCLAIPGKIIAITEQLDETFRKGKVSFGGIMKEVSLYMVPEAKVDDYVLVHVGVAINIVDEEEAKLMYQSLTNNRERGEQLHASIECLVEMCDTMNDQFLAIGIKHRISKILLCLTTSEVTPYKNAPD